MKQNTKKAVFCSAAVCALLLLAALASCTNLSVPKHVEVKAEPKIHVPLGNPVTKDLLDAIRAGKVKQMLKDFGDGIEIFDYRYGSIRTGELGTDTVDGNQVQTYLAHYKVEHEFDLSDYMDTTITTSPIALPSGLSSALAAVSSAGSWGTEDYLYITNESSYSYLATANQDVVDTLVAGNISIRKITDKNDTQLEPAQSIALSSQNLANKADSIVLKTGPGGITLKVTGLDASDNPSSGEGKFQIRVPQLGIDGFTGGVYFSSGERHFYGTTPGTYELLPENDKTNGNNPHNRIDVFVRLRDGLSGNLTFSIDFKWESARVNIGEDGLISDRIENIDVGDIYESMGGAKIDSIPAYLYVDTDSLINNIPSIKIASKAVGTEAEWSALTDPDDFIYNGTNRPQKRLQAGFLPEDEGIQFASVITDTDTTTGYIGKFADFFNADGGKNLSYRVQLTDANGWQTVSNNGNNEKTITVDVLLVLPLQFTVTANQNNELKVIGGNKYIKINNESIDDALKDDVLGRSDGENLDIMGGSFNGQLSVTVKQVRNNVFNGLGIGIGIEDGGLITKPFTYLSLAHGAVNPPVGFTNAEINPAPFKPTVLLLAKSENGTTASFSIKPLREGVEPEFDFKLAVDAAVAFEYEVM